MTVLAECTRKGRETLAAVVGAQPTTGLRCCVQVRRQLGGLGLPHSVLSLTLNRWGWNWSLASRKNTSCDPAYLLEDDQGCSCPVLPLDPPQAQGSRSPVVGSCGVELRVSLQL
jgi:hypothetical protein